jgi:hypothetical protein
LQSAAVTQPDVPVEPPTLDDPPVPLLPHAVLFAHAIDPSDPQMQQVFVGIVPGG